MARSRVLKPAKRRPKGTDRKLREWVFRMLASPDIAGDAAVANMQMQFDWIKNGAKPTLRLVAGKEASA